MYSTPKADVILLKPLPDKGTIGVFSPSSPVEATKLEAGVHYLEQLGYRVHLAPSCYKSDAYLAGSGAERAHDLMSLIRDQSIDAIFCTRGGFSSIMMLPYLDFDEIRKARKMIVGFSDVTALQWAIWKKAGIPSISAGMVGTDMAKIPINSEFEFYFWELIKTGELSIKLNHKPDTFKEVDGFSLPGTMSVGAMLLGSSYFPDTKGSIMILEDVDEPRHKIEAYLQQYRLSGVFDNANAIIFGAFTPSEKEQYPEVPSLDTVLNRAIDGLQIPVIKNFNYGHIPGKISLPVGGRLSVSLGETSLLKTRHSIIDR